MQYKKVFSTPKEEAKVKNPKVYYSSTETENTIENIRDAVDKISHKGAAGPDGVPAILLKKGKKQISIRLEIIWRKSPETGEIPDVFKLTSPQTRITLIKSIKLQASQPNINPCEDL